MRASDDRLNTLRTMRDRAKQRFPLELPAPSLKLDLEARAKDPKREFRHIYQSCTLAVLEIKVANTAKLAYELDGYISAVEGANIPFLYIAARTSLEHAAFLSNLAKRLLEKTKGPPSDWKTRGEGFFKLLTRARIGTTNQELASKLSSLGASKESLKPFNIGDCWACLAEHSGFDN